MSSNFAVVGAGSIGAWLISELLEYKAKGKVNTIKVLSRDVSPYTPSVGDQLANQISRFFAEKGTTKSKSQQWFDKGAEFTQVDYADEATLARVFEGVDVVFSTINSIVVDQQKSLARAAKTADVKLFVPSEYGVDTENATSGVFLAKKEFSEFLKEIELPYVKIFTGLWTDYCITP